MRPKTQLDKSYGGVVFDHRGHILIREPTNHFGGYVWTFPKGHATEDETPAETALREVQEETGVIGHIVAPIPGTFKGARTITTYYLMRSIECTNKWGAETTAIAWCTPIEARSLIALTTYTVGRDRDLWVLKLASRLWQLYV